MSKEKKNWSKPELIVLVRSKPEEVVLTACKKVGGGGEIRIGGAWCDDASMTCGGCAGLGSS